jgi:hypothetical protein
MGREIGPFVLLRLEILFDDDRWFWFCASNASKSGAGGNIWNDVRRMMGVWV